MLSHEISYNRRANSISCSTINQVIINNPVPSQLFIFHHRRNPVLNPLDINPLLSDMSCYPPTLVATLFLTSCTWRSNSIVLIDCSWMGHQIKLWIMSSNKFTSMSCTSVKRSCSWSKSFSLKGSVISPVST